MYILYMLGVLFCFITISSLLAITRSGARAEIAARGVGNVGMVTLRIAAGDATFGEKATVVVMTALGAFISPLWLITSAIIGGVLYAIFHMWLGWT